MIWILQQKIPLDCSKGIVAYFFVVIFVNLGDQSAKSCLRYDIVFYVCFVR
jgi:hypothetical protein